MIPKFPRFERSSNKTTPFILKKVSIYPTKEEQESRSLPASDRPYIYPFRPEFPTPSLSTQEAPHPEITAISSTDVPLETSGSIIPIETAEVIAETATPVETVETVAPFETVGSVAETNAPIETVTEITTPVESVETVAEIATPSETVETVTEAEEVVSTTAPTLSVTETTSERPVEETPESTLPFTTEPVETTPAVPTPPSVVASVPTPVTHPTPEATPVSTSRPKKPLHFTLEELKREFAKERSQHAKTRRKRYRNPLINGEIREELKDEYYWEILSPNTPEELRTREMARRAYKRQRQENPPVEKEPENREVSLLDAVFIEPVVNIGHMTIISAKRFQTLFQRGTSRMSAFPEELQPPISKKDGRPGDLVISIIAGILIAVVFIFPIIRLTTNKIYMSIRRSNVREIGQTVMVNNESPSLLQVLIESINNEDDEDFSENAIERDLRGISENSGISPSTSAPAYSSGFPAPQSVPATEPADDFFSFPTD